MKTVDMGDVIEDPQNLIVYVTTYMYFITDWNYAWELYLQVNTMKVNGEQKKAA